MPDPRISITPKLGATAGDHLHSAAVPTAVAVAAAATYPRLRAQLEPTVAPVRRMGATFVRAPLT
jgi:hypothetical protein